jgi:DNA-binding winged helix-turn-helix (wHTH) protein
MRPKRTHVQFQPDSFTAVYAGETIHLLPKEYALLEFLYHNRNRAFSREELLNRVWPLEEPGDRTVDDHIYRLRKKLKSWEPEFAIETVRGYGYRFVQRENSPLPNPLLQDSKFAESVSTLFHKYHGMGMGAAMQTLAAHQDVLGIEMDPFYRVYIRFVVGDFGWIAETEELTFWEKVVYLLHLYAAMELDAGKALPFFERLSKEKHCLPKGWQTDTDLNLVALYLETGQLEQAEAQLRRVQPVVDEMNSDSFSLIFHVEQLYHAIYAGDDRAAAEAVEAAEELLQKVPMQRELGMFTIAKGLWRYTQGNLPEAREKLDEGLDVLKQTRFVPHLIGGVRHIIQFLDRFDCDPEWKRKYTKIWNQLAEQYRFAEWKPKMLQQLQNGL